MGSENIEKMPSLAQSNLSSTSAFFSSLSGPSSSLGLSSSSRPLSQGSSIEKREAIAKPENTSVVSHSELMSKLIRVLDTTREQVYNGCIVETAVVSLAEIETSQQGAQFRRTKEGDEQFSLRFKDVQEYEKFLNYYRQHYPALIKEAKPYSQPFTQVVLDTGIFEQQVLLALDAQQKSISKSEDLSVRAIVSTNSMN